LKFNGKTFYEHPKFISKLTKLLNNIKDDKSSDINESTLRNYSISDFLTYLDKNVNRGSKLNRIETNKQLSNKLFKIYGNIDKNNQNNNDYDILKKKIDEN